MGDRPGLEEVVLEEVLAAARVDEAVFALRPDYRAVLIAVDGLVPGPSDSHSEELLRTAESFACQALQERPVDQLPNIAAWRNAYKAFGAKPSRTRNSVEALTRRAPFGLPRVNQLTDIYNAISVRHQLPVGGEDLRSYSGAPQLLRATGGEKFDTVAGGVDVVEHPEPGEVVWSDDAGVTCRCWNWRQARRTRLRDDTTTALFILDALDPMTDEELVDAADELSDHLQRLAGSSFSIARRVLCG